MKYEVVDIVGNVRCRTSFLALAISYRSFLQCMGIAAFVRFR